MFPTNSESLIGISDAFSVFVYGYPSSCPRAHCTSNKSVPTLRYTLCLHVALRPRRRDGLLGTGTEWEGDERVKARTAETARKRPERLRGPPPELPDNGSVKAVSPRHSVPPNDLCTEQLLFQLLCWTESLRLSR